MNCTISLAGLNNNKMQKAHWWEELAMRSILPRGVSAVIYRTISMPCCWMSHCMRSIWLAVSKQSSVLFRKMGLRVPFPFQTIERSFEEVWKDLWFGVLSGGCLVFDSFKQLWKTSASNVCKRSRGHDKLWQYLQSKCTWIRGGHRTRGWSIMNFAGSWQQRVILQGWVVDPFLQNRCCHR